MTLPLVPLLTDLDCAMLEPRELMSATPVGVLFVPEDADGSIDSESQTEPAAEDLPDAVFVKSNSPVGDGTPAATSGSDDAVLMDMQLPVMDGYTWHGSSRCGGLSLDAFDA